jgi:hypothetical protein
MPTYLLVEVPSLLKGFSGVKGFIMVLHFEADITRRRHQICLQAFFPFLNRTDLARSVRLQLKHLLYDTNR